MTLSNIWTVMEFGLVGIVVLVALICLASLVPMWKQAMYDWLP